MKKNLKAKIWVWGIVLTGVLSVQGMAAEAVDPNGPARSEVLRKQIMESQIQPLFLSITTVSQMDLDELIASLDRLEVPSGPAKASEPSSSSQSPAVKAGVQEGQPAQEKENPPAVQAEETAVQAPVDPEWLTQIDAVNQPVEPMALGDVLFSAGQMERAERFYRMILEKADLPNDPDWQWAMYQRANCLRRSRPAEARKLYQELIKKAPNSSWSGAATAQQATLTWFESVQKSKIKRFVIDPNSLP